MTCEACAIAETNASTGRIDFPCPECIARSLASSPAYFDSELAGAMSPTYRAALAHFFPNDMTEGHAMVKRWAAVRLEHERRVRSPKGVTE